MTTVLDHLADTRTGDKGDTLILAVLPRGAAEFHHLVSHLTEEVIAHHFQVRIDAVTREVVGTVESMVFKIKGILGGGVTGSPVLDGHGKTLSYHALSIKLPVLTQP